MLSQCTGRSEEPEVSGLGLLIKIPGSELGAKRCRLGIALSEDARVANPHMCFCSGRLHQL